MDAEALSAWLVERLEAWRDDRSDLASIGADAYALWLAHDWPTYPEGDPRETPIVVLQTLASGRSSGLSVADVPWLLELLAERPGDPFARMVELAATVDPRSRDRPTSEESADLLRTWAAQQDVLLRSREDRTLHDGVRHDPESVWDDVAARIRDRPDDPFTEDLLEDLLFWHADAFVDRLIELHASTPRATRLYATTEIGGVTSEGLDRWNAYRETLSIA